MVDPLVALFVAFNLVCLALTCWLYWRRFRELAPHKPFNYRITDIWAAMAGLTPTMLLIKFVDQYSSQLDIDREDQIVWLVLIGFSQVAGLFMGRINIELPPHRGAKNAWQSAVSIVTGALAGIVVLCACSVSLGFLGSILGFVLRLLTTDPWLLIAACSTLLLAIALGIAAAYLLLITTEATDHPDEHLRSRPPNPDKPPDKSD